MSEAPHTVVAMRILHTSDWHIGRTFHGSSTLSDLAVVLGALVDRVRALGVDVVVVAGDVFDTAAPAPACYTVLTDTLVALREAGAQVIVTSGNHDSAARLGFQSRLLRDGIHVVTDPQSVGSPITIADEHGPVHFYGLPYLEPALLRHVWPEAAPRTQAQALAHATSLARADAAARRGRSVLAAHCFTSNVEATAHLERDIQQGGLDIVPLSVFEGFDYVALGHIHGRQTLAEGIRYSGSPLYYSFGERDARRGGWLVDLDGEGIEAVSWVDLPVPRLLRVLEATLDELLDDPRFAEAEDAWVSARYTDRIAQRDAMRRLQVRFPHCAEVRHTPAVVAAAAETTFAARVGAAETDLELLDAFLAHVRNGVGVTEAETELLRQVLGERAVAEVGA